MPTVAGILMLTAAIFNILWIAVAFTRILDIKMLLRVTRVISPLPYIGLATGFGGNTTLSSILAVVFVFGILFCVVGGIFALRRRMWSLTLTGALGAFICVPCVGIAAIILTVASKSQFAGQE